MFTKHTHITNVKISGVYCVPYCVPYCVSMPTLSVPRMNLSSQKIPPEFQALFASYVGCVFFHYIAANIYPWMCTPITWTGLILSPFYAPMPHCRGLAWAVYNGNDAIGHMWVGLGGWCMLMIGRRVFVSKP